MQNRNTILSHLNIVFVVSTAALGFIIAAISLIVGSDMRRTAEANAFRQLEGVAEIEKPRFQTELVNELFYAVEKRAGSMETNALGAGGKIALFKADGSIIYSSHNFAPSLREAALTELKHSGLLHLSTRDGEVVYGTPIGFAGRNIGWVILTQDIDTSKLNILSNGTQAVFVAITLMLLINSIAVRQALNKSLLDPLRQINEVIPAVQAYSSGGVAPQEASTPFRLAEIEQIRETLMEMAHTMRVMRFSELRTERLVAVAQMTQMLAHDVRKPFSMLRMGLTMLSNAKDPESLKKVMSRIVPEIDKAMSSVDGMIADVMEVGSVSTNLIQEPASPESLFESTLGEIIRIYPEANITFNYELKHEHMANVHVQKIGRVFSNIVGNAFQAMRNKGLMWFKTSERDGMIEFCIGNGGSVIPAESLPKLFEAFFTSGKKGGTGLGLAIAQKIVTAHGGKIWCESVKTAAHPDGKVEFFFTLPIAGRINRTTATLPHHSYDIAKQLGVIEANAPPSLSIDKGELSLEEDLVQHYTNSNLALRVLIIDDETIYRSALASYLTRTPELSKALDIIQVDGSNAALQEVSERYFDLIITDMDMGMTSLDGFELVKELRKCGSKALICVHSNRICAGDNKAAIDAGAESFMPKPMARAQLLRIALQAAALAASKISLTETALVDAGSNPSKPGVLIIDDSAFVIYAWEQTLMMDTNLYTMQSFEELQERLATEPDFLQRLNYVVTDMHLDGSRRNGLDVGRLIKSIRWDLPVLMSSNDTFENHDLAGAVDKIIAKEPVGISELDEWCAKLMT